MKLKQIINIIEENFPVTLAYDWDNPGLLCGSAEREIKSVLLTLDVNSKVVEEAVAAGVELILSHHPILLGGVRQINYDSETGRMLRALIKNDICVYAAHTNMDVAANGINAELAKVFELKNTAVLMGDYPISDVGLGRIGDLTHPMTLAEFANVVKERLSTPYVRVSGDLNMMVGKIAIGSGGCSECIPTALKKGADVMLTADVKYHCALDSTLDGIAVIDAGHFPTEIIAMDIFASLLDKCGLNLIKSKNNDVFQYV